MEKTFLLILFILLSTQSFGQESTSELKRINEGLEDLRTKMHRVIYDEVLSQANLALEYAEIHENDSIAIKANALISMYHNMRSQYFISTEYAMRALEIARNSGDKYSEVRLLNNMGWGFVQSYNYERGIEFLKKAKSILDQLDSNKKNNKLAAVLYNNIAINYTKINALDSAFLYNKLAEKTATETNYKLPEAWILAQYGPIYEGLGQIEKAKEYYLKSIENSDNYKWPDAYVYTIANYTKLLNALGEYDQSIKLGLQGLRTARKSDQRIYIIEISDHLQQAFENKNQIDSAYRYSILSNTLRDSVFNGQKVIQIENIFFSREIKEKELQHQKEVLMQTRQRNILLTSGLFIMIIAGGLWSRLRYVRKSKALLQLERDRSENLLLNILPFEIAEELKEKGEAAAQNYDSVTILFTDFKEFTQVSQKLSAQELVHEINVCFKAFDAICEKYNVEKIKTIGDAYMAASGLPVPDESSVKNIVLAAIEMQDFVKRRKIEQDKLGHISFQMRAGINTGPVVAGIVGVKKFQYDIWGDTVNTASRIESHGDVDRVNVSKSTYNHIKDCDEFIFEERGTVEVKGKGSMQMYFVSMA